MVVGTNLQDVLIISTCELLHSGNASSKFPNSIAAECGDLTEPVS